MRNIKSVDIKDIQVGDLVKIQNAQYYVSFGDEVTDLVEKFASSVLVIYSISQEINEFGERMYCARNEDLGSCTFTDHEIAQAYRIVED